MKHQPLLCSLGIALLVSMVARGETGPTAVSPGSTESFVGYAQRCPTFSWAPPADARPLELVVYEVTAEGGWGASEPPLIHLHLPPRTSSWTPPSSSCLTAGRRYTWLIRGVLAGEESSWSKALLFALDGGSSAVEPAVLQAASLAAEPSGPPEAAPSRPRRDEPIRPVETEESSRRLQLHGLSTAQASSRPPESLAFPPPSDNDLWVRGSIYVGHNLYFADPTHWRETISAVGFQLGSENETDEWERSTAGFGWISTAGDLDIYLVAPVDVPLEGEPLDIYCSIYDNHATANATVNFKLHRRHREDHWTYAPGSATTSDSSTDVVRVYGTVVGLPDPRNSGGEYWWLEVHWQPQAAGSALRFYGCSVRLRMDVLRF